MAQAHTAALAGIGLGANLGDPAAMLHAAIAELGGLPGTSRVGMSPFYRCAPVDSSGPDYLNAVVLLRTALAPHALLTELQRIEAGHGRERPYRNAPRTLDLDLLFHADTVLATPTLTLPHPRLHERAFVLRPLADVAPTLILPGLGLVADWLPRVRDQDAIRIPS